MTFLVWLICQLQASMVHVTYCQHIEVETKWFTFSKRHLQMLFPEWKCINFDWDFTEICFQQFNLQFFSTGSDKRLAPSRDNSLIKPMMVRLLTHICAIQPQRVKALLPSNVVTGLSVHSTYTHYNGSALFSDNDYEAIYTCAHNSLYKVIDQQLLSFNDWT